MTLLTGVLVTLLGGSLGFGSAATGIYLSSVGKGFLSFLVIHVGFLVGCVLFVNGMTSIAAA